MNVKWFAVISAFLLGFNAPVSAQQELASRIVEIDGSAELKSSGAADYRPAKVWSEFRDGDLLRPALGSIVFVLCANNRLQIVPDGAPVGLRTICPTFTRSTDARGSDELLLLLGSRFEFASQLLDPQPTLQWPTVADSCTYRVRVNADGEEIWSLPSTDLTAVEYEGPALMLGETYQLTVDAGGEESYSLQFALFDGDRDYLEQAIAEIKSADISADGKMLAIANVYEQHDLKFEAIAVLEALADKGSETAAVYGMLGDLYLRVGWRSRAEEFYRTALELAEVQGELEGVTAAQFGLAKVAAAGQEVEGALDWLRLARAGYGELGRTETEVELSELIERLTAYLQGPRDNS